MPLSPHLPIYRVQVTSLLSIMHRLSELFLYTLGCFFSLGFFLCVICPDRDGGLSSYPELIYGTAFFINIVLAYHLTSMLRYLFWDMGLGFDCVFLTGCLSVVMGVVFGMLPFAVQRLL